MPHQNESISPKSDIDGFDTLSIWRSTCVGHGATVKKSCGSRSTPNCGS
jgi:hypothetical protein